MTEKLASLLNLPPIPEETTTEEATTFVEEHREIITEVDSAISKIDAALPLVRDLDSATDGELDDLADLAKKHAEDLMDLGLNIDPRFAGVIMQTAGTMLGHAITAKTAKMDKKLRMISLQLQKARLDHQITKDTKKGEVDEEPVDGQGMVLDRNDLLKQILEQSKSEKK
jgi:hypothetical protein